MKDERADDSPAPVPLAGHRRKGRTRGAIRCHGNAADQRELRAPALTGGIAKLGADRPKLVVVEGITLASPADPYLSLKALADYCGCSVRWLRDQLVDPLHPLPCFRLPGGKILVRRSQFDDWVARYRSLGNRDIERLMADMLAGLNPVVPPAAR